MWPGVTAGAMISGTVGETSAMFLVVTTMKSNGFMPSAATSGIDLRTEKMLADCKLRSKGHTA